MTAQIKVSYQDPDGRGRYLPFFVNFVESMDDEWAKNSIWEDVYNRLDEEYGARLIKTGKGVAVVEFPTAEDATLFLLRWT